MMRKIFASLLMVVTSVCLGQTFPVNNLTVSGTSNFSGQSTFTLSPLSPTPTIGDNSQKTATTSFVNTAVSGALTGFAPISNPNFLGVPTAPTAALGTNTTQLATTAFVANHSSCKNILDYGGNNTNGASNNTALTNALNASAAISNQICVEFPAGWYNFSAAFGYTLPNVSATVTLLGAGADTSILDWIGGGGMVLAGALGQNNSVHVRGFTFLTGVAGGGATGLFLNNTDSSATGPVPIEISDISDVRFGGDNGNPGTHYWTFALSVTGWSNVNFSAVNVYGGSGGGTISGYTNQGNGITFAASASVLAVQYNVWGSNFNYLAQGISYGNYIQGLSVAQCNFTGGAIGIDITGTAGTDQLTVTGSQFNQASYGILDNGGTAGFSVVGNYFLMPTPTSGSTYGIAQLSEYGSSIIGNAFQGIGAAGTNTNGVSIGTRTNIGAVISGNSFTRLNNAIVLQSSSSNNNVQSNIYGGNTSNVVNNGTGNAVGGGSQ